jgi:hypothetical protein
VKEWKFKLEKVIAENMQLLESTRDQHELKCTRDQLKYELEYTRTKAAEEEEWLKSKLECTRREAAEFKEWLKRELEYRREAAQDKERLESELKCTRTEAAQDKVRLESELEYTRRGATERKRSTQDLFKLMNEEHMSNRKDTARMMEFAFQQIQNHFKKLCVFNQQQTLRNIILQVVKDPEERKQAEEQLMKMMQQEMPGNDTPGAPSENATS